MWYDRIGGTQHGGAQNKRRHGRVRCQGIMCSFGEIMDLSASGMRVETAIRPPNANQVIHVTVQTHEGPLAVAASVVWSRKTGFFKREIGLRFVDLLPGAAVALSRLGSSAAYNETVIPDVQKFRHGQQ